MPQRNRNEERERKIQFGIWLGTPSEARVPKYQEDLAKQIDIRPETLSRWQDDPLVLEAKASALKLYFSQAKAFEVAGKIYDMAMKGNVAAQRLFMQVTGNINNAGSSEPQEAQKVEISFIEAKPKKKKDDESGDKTEKV